jgi:uncharacterized membrane protein YoaK (UPF0700 family)
MNRFNVKKVRASRRRKIVKTVAKWLSYIAFAIIGAIAMWATVWMVWIIFG